MIFAAIDMGTNSCRLLIYCYTDDSGETIFRRTTTCRLGEGLGMSGRISEKAMEKAADCLEEYKRIMTDQQVDIYHVVATSAVREAINQREFIQFLRTRCNIDPEIISGKREAELSYKGAMTDWQGEKDPVIIDLGGGSTEIIWRTAEIFSESLPLGAVRAAEAQMSAADIAAVISGLGSIAEELTENPLIMVGGTVTTLVAVKLAMEVYDPARVHGQMLTRREIGDIYNLLARMSLRLRRRVPGLQPERADIIVHGTLIVLLLLEYFNKTELIVSENDILNGIIKELYDRSLKKD